MTYICPRKLLELLNGRLRRYHPLIEADGSERIREACAGVPIHFPCLTVCCDEA